MSYYQKVVLLDDGREAYVAGGVGRYGEAELMHLIFAEQGSLQEKLPGFDEAV